MNQRIERWIKEVEGSLYGSDTKPTAHSAVQLLGDRPQLVDTPCVATDVRMDVQTEAKELIHSWLHKEENPSYDDGYDWLPSDDVDIQSAVTSIMDDLMNKPLDYATVGRGDSEKRTDPRVAMEMRHKKIKAKRQAREQAQQEVMREHIARKEARRRATQEVLRAEKEMRQRDKEEERMVQLEMARIRKQMREERERQRLHEETKKEKLHPNSTKTCTSASVKRRTHSKHHNPPTTSHVEGTHTIPPPPVAVHPHTSRHPEPTTSGDRDEGGSEVKGAGKTCKVTSLQLAEKKSQQSQKQRLRILHNHFGHWYLRLLAHLTSYSKAEVTADWKETCRVWRTWRAALEERREEVAVANSEAIKNEQRLMSAGTSHWRKKLLAKCVNSWKRVVREENGRRVLEKEANLRKNKMATLLSTLQSVDSAGQQQKQVKSQGSALITSRIVRQELERILSEGKLQVVENPTSQLGGAGGGVATVLGPPVSSGKVAQPKLLVAMEKRAKERAQRREERLRKKKETEQQQLLVRREGGGSDTRESVERGYSPVKDTSDKKDQPGVVTSSKDTVESVGSLPQSSHPESSEDGHQRVCPASSEPTQPVPTQPIPTQHVPRQPVPTQPVVSVLSAMEKRSLEIARRKEERLRRREQLERERLAKEKEEEERKAREILEAKEAAVAQKRREKELARQREEERQHHLQHVKELNVKAVQHYKDHLCRRGLSLWKQFVKAMKQMMLDASYFYGNKTMGQYLSIWVSQFEARVSHMEQQSEMFYSECVQRRVLSGMREHIHLRADQLSIANKHYILHTLKAHMKAWVMFVTEERLTMWDKLRRAKVHREKSLKAKMFQAWRRYLPLERQDRVVEKRKAVLRAKVASWLTDYDPTLT